jgi:hypothetical protein
MCAVVATTFGGGAGGVRQRETRRCHGIGPPTSMLIWLGRYMFQSGLNGVDDAARAAWLRARPAAPEPSDRIPPRRGSAIATAALPRRTDRAPMPLPEPLPLRE